MEMFIQTVSNQILKTQLERAINGRKPFMRFKDILLDYPQERERWFQYEKAAKHQRLKAWLQSHQIDCFQPVQSRVDEIYVSPIRLQAEDDDEIIQMVQRAHVMTSTLQTKVKERRLPEDISRDVSEIERVLNSLLKMIHRTS